MKKEKLYKGKLFKLNAYHMQVEHRKVRREISDLAAYLELVSRRLYVLEYFKVSFIEPCVSISLIFSLSFSILLLLNS